MSGLSAYLAGVGRAVAYYPRMAKFLGSVNASILFSQLFYWQERTENELGVFKTAEEWEEETGLTYREQATARKALRERGFLHETHQRLQHRMFFRLDIDAIDTAFDSWMLDQKSPERQKRNSGIQPDFPNDESAIREERETHLAGDVFRNPSNEQRLHTEITTEITEAAAVDLPVLEQETASPPPAMASELSRFLLSMSVHVPAGNVHMRNWVANGVTASELASAVLIAQQRRAGSVQPVNAGLLDMILADVRAGQGANLPPVRDKPAWGNRGNGEAKGRQKHSGFSEIDYGKGGLISDYLIEHFPPRG